MKTLMDLKILRNGRISHLVFLVVLAVGMVVFQDGVIAATWDNSAPGGGNKNKWGTAGQQAQNWDTNSTPNATGATASFPTLSPGDTTISLEINPTVGVMFFDSSISYSISPGGSTTITFNGSAGDGQLNVATTNTANHTISALVSLADSLAMAVQGSGTMALSGAISGVGGISSSGTGTVVVSASNTYAGSTMISLGSFFIDGDQTGATGAVSVGNATLGGIGTIGGATTFVGSGTLAPGNGADSTGTLTFANNLTLSDDSKVTMQITGTAAGDFDRIAVAGTAFVDGDLIINITTGLLANGTNFNLFNLTNAPVGTFDSIALTGGTYAGALTYNSGVWSANFGAQTVTFTQSTNVLLITTVPEPASILTLSLGLGLMFWFKRARRANASV